MRNTQFPVLQVVDGASALPFLRLWQAERDVDFMFARNHRVDLWLSKVWKTLTQKYSSHNIIVQFDWWVPLATDKWNLNMNGKKKRGLFNQQVQDSKNWWCQTSNVNKGHLIA